MSKIVFKKKFSFFRKWPVIALLLLLGVSKAPGEEKKTLLMNQDRSQKPYSKESSTVNQKTKTYQETMYGLFFEAHGGLFWGLEKISHLITKNTYDIDKLEASFQNLSHNKSLSVTGTGGLKLGIWLEKAHYFYHRSPKWLKYFGCYFDLNYQYFKFDHRKETKIRYLDFSGSPSLGPASATTSVFLKTKGPSMLAELLFAGRLGFYKTKEVPFGIFQPYLAIGPAAFFIKQKAKLIVSPHQTDNQNQLFINIASTQPMDTKHFDKKVFPALALALGFDIRPFKHLSFDYFFKYCYVAPHFSYSAFLWSQKEYCHLFSNQLGIAYHY